MFKEFYSSAEGQGRISIYKHYTNENKEDKFKLLGRYATNNIYNKYGRGEYSANEGFIAKGWEMGTFKIEGIPKWTHKGKEYKDFIKQKWSINDSTLNKITMKSRSFHIRKIENEDSRPPLGIVVFEQMSPQTINEESIQSILKNHQEQLIFLIKSMKSIS